MKNWKWAPGMLYRDSDGQHRITSERHAASVAESAALGFVREPVTDDPATLGCMLAWAREAWGDPALFVVQDGDVWRVARWEGGLVSFATGATEGAALIAAIKESPNSPLRH